MNTDILKQLGIGDNVNLSDKDMQMLTKLLSSLGTGGKKLKMTASERNNLISKLSTFQNVEEAPKKEMKDMTEDEKTVHREELKKKLRKKQNEKKMMRTSNLQKKKVLGDPSDKFKDILGTVAQGQEEQKEETKEEAKEEDLSDFVN